MMYYNRREHWNICSLPCSIVEGDNASEISLVVHKRNMRLII